MIARHSNQTKGRFLKRTLSSTKLVLDDRSASEKGGIGALVS